MCVNNTTVCFIGTSVITHFDIKSLLSASIGKGAVLLKVFVGAVLLKVFVGAVLLKVFYYWCFLCALQIRYNNKKMQVPY